MVSKENGTPSWQGMWAVYCHCFCGYCFQDWKYNNITWQSKRPAKGGAWITETEGTSCAQAEELTQRTDCHPSWGHGSREANGSGRIGRWGSLINLVVAVFSEIRNELITL